MYCRLQNIENKHNDVNRNGTTRSDIGIGNWDLDEGYKWCR